MRQRLGVLVVGSFLFGCVADGEVSFQEPDAEVDADAQPDAEASDASPSDAASDASSLPVDAEGDAGDAATPTLQSWHELSPLRAGSFVVLSEDGHEYERISISSQSAGSVHGVKAGEGVFYFEMKTLVDDPRQHFGVGPADMSLEEYVGDHPMSLGVSALGAVFVEGGAVATFAPGAEVFGFVVDRRGADPVVHVIASTPGAPQGEIVATHAFTSFDGPVHAYASGPRLALGTQARFNAGWDTINEPFTYDPGALLAPVDADAAAALVRGWGRSEAHPWNAPPVVAIVGPSITAPGAPVALTITAHDEEDGDLGASVVLEDDALPHSEREIILEPGSIYRTDVLGRHRLRAWVRDSGGKLAQAVHVVDVEGGLPIHPTVRLVGTPSDGAILSEDGHGVRFTLATKDGVRANQGLIDGYWYFEASHVGPYGNFGAGLVVQEGSIAPYALRAVPASMSVNFISGIWHDIIWVASQPDGGPHETVGFAVDFRRDLAAGRDYPTVHVILAGVLAASVPMVDATTPVHPMLYGTIGEGTGPQLVANFGETSFTFDARAILAAAGHSDAGQLRLGWGVNAN